MKNSYLVVVSLLLAVISVSSKGEAQQLFSPQAAVLSDGDVLNLGTTVLAFDVGNVSATVNSVDFSGGTTGSNGVTLSFTGFENTDFNGVTTPPPAGYSANLTNILLSLHFSGDGSETHSLSFDNLTPGDVYDVQLFSGSGAGGYQVLADGSASGDLSYGGTDHTYSIVETFTADQTGIETIGYTSPTTYVLFNAVNLRDVTSVPEPSAFALLFGSLGVVAWISVQRRRFSV